MPNQNDTVVVPMPDDQCDIAIAQYTIGQKYTRELREEVRALANGAQVRPAGPKHPITYDLRPRRINLVTDVDGIIVGIKCG
ncbi:MULTISPECIES: I78 family peptidase inhibitor [unclassified Pseudomonas]|uniref:I78 family peptidase inhibitor n=1 Tax=unclassified Pseudomonas TaxID=196821 RepID=UPI0016737F30|nr:I78 family peptidase inhibitor [Pseudomonas sp. SWRI179]